jgi:ABC-2 type transport system ATP-binding protein
MAVVEVQDVRKRYGEVTALDGVSLSVEQGEVLGILGRNGAGKTTLVECIAGVRVPEEGRISVLGLDPVKDRAHLRQVLGMQLQDSALPEKLRVREATALYRSFYAEGADPDRLLDDLGLAAKRDTFFEDLSGGQQQRLSVALALVGKPRVVILDELTTGLDPQARRGIWSMVEGIRRAGVTVLLVTHSMEEAERLCDRIAVIDRGRIVALDTPTGLSTGDAGSERLVLRTDEPFDLALLADLPEVGDVHRDRDEIVVTGDGSLLAPVVVALTRNGITPTETRLERSTLEEAFLALTGDDADDAIREEATR